MGYPVYRLSRLPVAHSPFLFGAFAILVRELEISPLRLSESYDKVLLESVGNGVHLAIFYPSHPRQFQLVKDREISMVKATN